MIEGRVKLRSMGELKDDGLALVYMYDLHGRRYAPCYKKNGWLHTAEDAELDPEKCLGWVPYLHQGITNEIPTSSESRQARANAGKWVAGLSAMAAVFLEIFVVLGGGYNVLQSVIFTWCHLLMLSGVLIGSMFWWRE